VEASLTIGEGIDWKAFSFGFSHVQSVLGFSRVDIGVWLLTRKELGLMTPPPLRDLLFLEIVGLLLGE